MNAAFLASAPLAAVSTGGGGNNFLHDLWQQTAIRFGTSGILGNTIFFMLDKALFPLIVQATGRLSTSTTIKWIHQNAASVSFFVAYLLDIAVQRKYLVLSTHMITQDTSLIIIISTLCRSSKCVASVWFGNYKYTAIIPFIFDDIIHCVSSIAL